MTIIELADSYAKAEIDDYLTGEGRSSHARANLLTAISALEAERDKWKRGYDVIKVEYDDLYDQHEKVLAERDALVHACGHYEAALHDAFPSGAYGHAFEHWNDARKILNEREALRGEA